MSRYRGLAICSGIGREEDILPIIDHLPHPLKVSHLHQPVQFLLGHDWMAGEFAVPILRQQSRIVRTTIQEIRQQGGTIYDTVDGLRARLGLDLLARVFLKTCDRQLYHVILGLQTPEECRLLKKKGFHILYVEGQAVTRWDQGYTLQCFTFDEVVGRTQHFLQIALRYLQMMPQQENIDDHPPVA